jgi:hypothetical protein
MDFISQEKIEVFQNLKDFKALVETQLGKKIKSLQTYNGGIMSTTRYIIFFLREGFS